MHHILLQVGLTRLKHTRPYASRSLADSNFYQFPKTFPFSLQKFGSNLVTMSSVPRIGSFQYIKQQFTQVSFSCLHYPIFYFRFSFCCPLPKQTVAEHNKHSELFLSVLVWLPGLLLVFLTSTITCCSKYISNSAKSIDSSHRFQNS